MFVYLTKGERSCNGIPIVINGQSGGAMVTCGFERSCDRADITGNNIVMVNCVGTRACMMYIFISIH